jgi:hypothetical protein
MRVGLLPALLISAALVPVGIRADLVFERASIDLAAPMDARELVAIYKFTNKGADAVKILEVRADCGCLSVILGKRDFSPGESGNIKVIFRVGDRVGRQEKNIKVITNEDERFLYDLFLIAELKSLAWIEPRLLLWAKGEKRMTKEIKVGPYGDKPITLGEARAAHDSVAIAIGRSGEKGEFNISVTPFSTNAEIRDTITMVVKSADGREKEYTAYIKAD